MQSLLEKRQVVQIPCKTKRVCYNSIVKKPHRGTTAVRKGRFSPEDVSYRTTETISIKKV